MISVDKASVYATSRLWRRTSLATAATTGVTIDNVNVDRAAYELVKYDQLPAVIVTEGLFGDILSDIVCARAGSPALCGSATINPDRPFGRGITALFEPAHGSSPHRTGAAAPTRPARGSPWPTCSPGAPTSPSSTSTPESERPSTP